jgi:hypothetical protein
MRGAILTEGMLLSCQSTRVLSEVSASDLNYIRESYRAQVIFNLLDARLQHWNPLGQYLHPGEIFVSCAWIGNPRRRRGHSYPNTICPKKYRKAVYAQ